VRDKAELTRQLVAQLPETAQVDFRHAMRTWWVNLRPGGGLRLSETGYLVFAGVLELERYVYTIPDRQQVNLGMILKLDKQLQSPYYIQLEKRRARNIVFFDSKEAVMANLYGSLDQFLSLYR